MHTSLKWSRNMLLESPVAPKTSGDVPLATFAATTFMLKHVLRRPSAVHCTSYMQHPMLRNFASIAPFA